MPLPTPQPTVKEEDKDTDFVCCDLYNATNPPPPDWRKRFPGLDTDDLPGGLASSYETITLATHNGTHVDAPKHYHPVDRNGDPMPGIDEMPLDWFMRPGVKFDFRHFDDGYLVTEADIEAELARIGHELQPLDIVAPQFFSEIIAF